MSDEKDIVLQFLKEHNLEVNRANYFEIAFFGERDYRKPQHPEIEAELPDGVRYDYDSLTSEQHKLLFADCSETVH
jgi:hypothetical protein